MIALTSITFSKAVVLRHGNACLCELADIVLDLPGHVGDASIQLDGIDAPVGPTSTTIGSAILQGVMAAVSGEFVELGVHPPVLQSGNLDITIVLNLRLFNKYRSIVSYL